MEEQIVKLDEASCSELSQLAGQTPAAQLALRWLLRGMRIEDATTAEIVIDAAHLKVRRTPKPAPGAPVVMDENKA